MVPPRCPEGPRCRDAAAPRGRRADVRGRDRDGAARSPRLDHGTLDHDPIRLNRIMISSLCSSMIFSENRFPLFRIMLYGPSDSLSRRPCPVRRFAVPDDGFAELLLQDNLAAIALGVERGNQNLSVRDHNDLRPL